MTTVNSAITVEPFIINSVSVNEYLYYIISLDIFTKYPDFIKKCRIDDKFVYLNDLKVILHHGVYISVQYYATTVTDGSCDVKLPRLFTNNDKFN